MSDLYEPYEKLIRIEVMGKTFEVPENNLLLRQMAFVAAVSRALVERAAAPVMARRGGSPGAWGRAGQVLGQGVVAVMRVPMAEAIERALEALVATGRPPRDDDGRSGPHVRVDIRHVR